MDLLISLLITLIVFGVVYGLIMYVLLPNLPLPPFIRTAIIVVMTLIFIIWLLRLLLPAAGLYRISVGPQAPPALVTTLLG